MIKQVRKRDGRCVDFEYTKIQTAIEKAVKSVGGRDMDRAGQLSRQVILMLETRWRQDIPSVEEIQDTIEEVLIRNSHVRVARAFILYREQRKAARETNALSSATIQMFSRYLDNTDWKVKENANQQKSVNGLNNYVRESFTRFYWLHEIYPENIREAHEQGDGHIHDLGFLGPYCAGWDLRQLLENGFGGVPTKVESRPAKHLRSFLGQIVNSTFTTQGECAGAQAWSSFDTYCAPFVRHDRLSYEQVKQCLQEFIFNLNIPTRVGFQCPFSNLTFDLKVPKTLAQQAVVIGGQMQETTYGEYQEEMDLFNQAFCEAMSEGDAKGRVFTFPIPTLNVTKDFDWDSPAVDAFMDITSKYGVPYFANYVNSDLSPDDAVSMCCRLRLNTKELRKRGGGLFGSNPLTGSVGVYTINMPRIGHLAKDKTDFRMRLLDQMEIARQSLEIKRKVIEQQTENGLYPYSANYLKEVKARTGAFWHNHFSTIGIVGLHEAMMNFNGRGIECEENQKFAEEILNYMRDVLSHFQEETGHVYNLEATPAEGTSHRFARQDKKRFGEAIYTSGDKVEYYTNSSQLPVNATQDIFELMEHQDKLQSLYTGGTVQHLYLGEKVESPEACKKLIQKIFENYEMPYVSITPTFSICDDHGYISGEEHNCPSCGKDAEVWSRVTGYLRPVENYNAGKKSEFQDREFFQLPEDVLVAAQAKEAELAGA